MHTNLGTLLVTQRDDLDGAEAAYRAAISADPGHAGAQAGFGLLLHQRAQQVVESGDNLAAAVALYDESVQLLSVGLGVDHEATRASRAEAAWLRRRL